MLPPLYNTDGTLERPHQQAASVAEQEESPPKVSLPDVPKGKCIATNPTLTPSAKEQWGGWCDEQCKPPSGDPDHCLTPEMTGAAGCVCG